MSVLSWNIQGLGQALKKHGLGNIISSNNIKVCGILETKCGRYNHSVLASKIVPRWSSLSNFHLDPRGRILVLWDPSFYDLVVIEQSPQHMGCVLTCRATGLRFGVCFVYGLHSVSSRRPLWLQLEHLVDNNQLPWLIQGDFNCVLNPNERLNCEPVRTYETSGLVEVCRNCDLLDAPSTCPNLYTWTNGTVWSKLDRVLANSHWSTTEYSIHADFLELWHLSDHKASIASLCRIGTSPNLGKRYFKFFNMWCAHPNFRAIVEEHWSTNLHGSYQFRLVKLLHGLKQCLRDLNNKDFSHISARAARANSSLTIAMNELLRRPSCPVAKLEASHAKSLAKRLNEAESSFLGQLAKAKYVLKSDSCNKYFHGLMRANSRHGHIAYINRSDGTRTSSTEEVSGEFITFFHSLFGTEVNVCRSEEHTSELQSRVD